jgi:hypothetical protein
MKKVNKEYKEVLNQLNHARPEEVGRILKRYFSLRKGDKK